MIEKLKNYKIILASQSPRRRKLLQNMDIEFETCSTDVDESYPNQLNPQDVAVYLSKKKSDFFDGRKMADNEIIITADTIVALNGRVISKPENTEDAKNYLLQLSNQTHIVYTGVTLKNSKKQNSFNSETKVWFKQLSDEEIDYYIKNYNPLDKAGAYGIQEWIGYIAIERIEGSFFNVMGLPTGMLYKELLNFID